jgi:hypothetical protein
MVGLREAAPCRLTRPNVGRSPLTPQKAAGYWIEPQVSDASVKGSSPAATAVAEPLEEPPDHRETSQGVRPTVRNLAPSWFLAPLAMSATVSVAHSTAPARLSRRTTVASWLTSAFTP